MVHISEPSWVETVWEKEKMLVSHNTFYLVRQPRLVCTNNKFVRVTKGKNLKFVV